MRTAMKLAILSIIMPLFFGGCSAYFWNWFDSESQISDEQKRQIVAEAYDEMDPAIAKRKFNRRTFTVLKREVKFDPRGMLMIEGGEFVMGTKDDTYGDKFVHRVYVSGFYMDRTEVTNRMYRYFLQRNPEVRMPSFIDDPLIGHDNMPVVDVSYADANRFCEYFGKRLPTEAEWEYAARGGTVAREFYWGNEARADLYNGREAAIRRPKPVGSYPANPFGLYDMHGNVREWVLDAYEPSFYKISPNVNPFNDNHDKFYVNRGGSFSYGDGYPATVSFRSFDKPDTSFVDLGFRCAKGVYAKDDLKTTYRVIGGTSGELPEDTNESGIKIEQIEIIDHTIDPQSDPGLDKKLRKLFQ